MRIALGADHAGFEMKERIKQHLQAQGIALDDEGTNSADSVDYPDFARKVATRVSAGTDELGILVCGTGMGMAMSANKIAGIRAANVTTEFETQMLREHNDGNVLCLGARVLTDEQALKLVDKFLHTDFADGRHQRRVDKVMALEKIGLLTH